MNQQNGLCIILFIQISYNEGVWVSLGDSTEVVGVISVVI